MTQRRKIRLKVNKRRSASKKLIWNVVKIDFTTKRDFTDFILQCCTEFSLKIKYLLFDVKNTNLELIERTPKF